MTSAEQAAQFPATPPLSDPSSLWYAGMVIDPTDFSEQLCQLQSALQHAGEPVSTLVRASKS